MHISTPGVMEMEERNCRWSRPFGDVQGQLNNSLNGDGDDEKRLSFEPGSSASAVRHIVWEERFRDMLQILNHKIAVMHLMYACIVSSSSVLHLDAY